MKRININRIKLTRKEREIEDALVRGEFVPVSPEEEEEIRKALEFRKKDAVLNIRVNRQDLENIKRKARKLGIKYQTFISELLHRVAHKGNQA